MWKIMVIDDEPKIRRGLCKFIEKSELPIEICTQSSDGESALQLMREHEPDIVLLDICMPHMNGIQFLTAVKASGIRAKCIVITGYDDFSYAQASVYLRAFAYMLKPIDELELHNTLKDAINELEMEKTQTQKSQHVNSLLENNHSALWNIFAQKWMNGTTTDQQLLNELNFWRITFPKQAFLTIIKPSSVKGNVFFRNEKQLMFYSVLNITEELMQSVDIRFCAHDEKDLCVIITAQFPNGDLLDEVRNVIKSHLNIHCQLQCVELSSPNEVSKLLLKIKSQFEEMENISPLFEEIKKYIDSNFHNQNLNLETLSNAMNVSQPYISKLFKTTLHTNFVDYLTEKRMNQAVQLMNQHEMKLALIAKKVGYANQHYFSAVFKKHFGSSPSTYRDKNFS